MRAMKFALAGLLCSTAFTAPAYAQDQGADEAFDEDVIIVTATRRAEDVQDIPIAVTAVSGVKLAEQGVINVQDVGSVAPSFSASNAQTASGTVVLRIRGIGTTSNNIGFESAVGIFVDGAYQSRPGVALGEFVDVERVEVLRGPQGTLFGRNTSAGALTITNNRPNLSEFGGFVNATYGNYDHMSLQGAINVPLVQDQLAFRLTGAYRKRDGYVQSIDRTGADNGESNNTDQYLIRGQLGFETEGGIKGRLIADYSKSTASCCAAIELLKSPVEAFGLFGAVGLGARGGMAAPVVATNRFDTTTAQRAADNLIATQSFESVNGNDQWGITGEVEFPISDSADLIYIGSYRKYSAQESYDSDFSGLDVFNILPGGGTKIKTMTHELRLQGEAWDDRLQYVVGGYYAKEDINQTVNFGLGADYGELVGALLFGPTGGALGANPLSLFTNRNIFPNSPLNVPGGIDPSVVRTTNAYTQNSKSWSIFGNVTFEVVDGLKINAGLRYSDESKDGSFSQPAINNPLCPAILGTIAAGNVPGALVSNIFGLGCFAFTAPAIGSAANPFPLPRLFDSNFKDDELIYTGKISYEFADPITVYASFTHGYKSGGFNLDSTAAAGGADPRFASEEVDAYEVGFKGKFLDNAVTLNVAGFIENFKNFQVLEFTGAQFRTFNVPKARTSGVEIEMLVRPTDGLTFNGGLTYAKAIYPNDCAGTQTAVNVLALCGNSHTNAPSLTGIAGISYDRDIGSDLKVMFNTQLRFESDRRTSTQAIEIPSAAAITAAGSVQAAIDAAALNPFDIQDGNVKINARIGIGSQDDMWGIEAWVTNLTNEITRGVTFSTTLRSGSRSTFVQEPRMYGLTLRGKF
jgi:outer membrane receptor protein involved in Fe transport